MQTKGYVWISHDDHDCDGGDGDDGDGDDGDGDDGDGDDGDDDDDDDRRCTPVRVIVNRENKP